MRELAVPIRTPDYRLRVYISSMLSELANERRAARDAVRRLRLAPVMFEAGARPYPPRDLYRSYLAQSHLFVGIYWQRYGSVAPDDDASAIEDEYRLSGDLPKLIYVKTPAPDREPALADLLARIQADGRASYRTFADAAELGELVQNDLAVLLTERFERSATPAPEAVVAETPTAPAPAEPPAAGAVPAPLTPLVGRDREVGDVLGLLRIGDVRLVTLTGPGGIGKSRVAMAVASRVAGGALDGASDVHWIEMSSLRDAQLVAPTLRRSLGIDAAFGEDAEAALVQALRDRQRPLLLVVDGFERLMPAAGLLAHLVDECPQIRLLVTSREVLNLRAEFEYPVPTLSLPRPDTAVEDSEAGRLFLAAAEAVAPQFEAAGGELTAVGEICRRLDGLPLAIELAAARVRTLPPSALLGRLGNRLDFLTGGPADAPERQRTLRATLAWDYDLLDADERALFRRLALALGGFTLGLAERLAASAGGLQVDAFDLLDSLVRKSLLRPEDDGPEPRFTMLETVREYALDQLEAAGECEPTHAAHASFFADLVDLVVLDGPALDRWLHVLDRERHNLWAALTWASESGARDIELRLCAGLCKVWEMHGDITEGAGRLEHVLAVTGDVESPQRLKVLGAASHLARARGDYTAGVALARDALALATRLDDTRGLANSHFDLAACAVEMDDLDTADLEFQAALEIWTALDEPMRIANMLNNLAVVAEARGDLDAALAGFLQALPVYIELRDETRLARSEMNLGRLLVRQGEAAPGVRMLVRSLARWLDLDAMWDLVDCLEYYGPALGRRGLAEAGVRAMAVAAALRERIGATRAPYMRARYDLALAELRAMLDPDEFASTWADAASLPYLDGIREALSVTPDDRLLDVHDWSIDAAELQQHLDSAQVRT